MPKNQLLGADFSKEELFRNSSDVVKLYKLFSVFGRKQNSEAPKWDKNVSKDLGLNKDHKQACGGGQATA
jgi:hypothetical protein